MKFTLRYKYIFNGPEHLPWHLFPSLGTIDVRDYLNMREYCGHLLGPPGARWQVRGSTWYFQDEADALQVMLTFS